MSETVTALFDASIERFSKRPAIQYFCPEKNQWLILNWLEVGSLVNRLASALKRFELEHNDRIALLSMTRMEWVISDIAIMKASCIVVPIYHSSLNDQIAYIMDDANISIIIVENEEQLKKVRQITKANKNIRQIIVFDQINGALKDNEIYFNDLLKEGIDEYETNMADKDAIASLVYTSGTTGEPKGAMISHDNLLYIAQAIDKLGVLSSEDVQLMFLPLAHIFARVLELSWIRTGHLLAFARSIEKVIDDMSIIKPTFMAGVPRIFEKVRAKTMETLLTSNRATRYLAQLAFDEADRISRDENQPDLRTWITKKLVFDKIGKKLKARFGDRLRFLVSGGAQLSSEVFTFFDLCGIVLCEGYGLTETTAATCLNLPWALRNKTVGRPLPGTEIKLGEDKEILVRGRGVFLGFWQKPEQTALVLDADGWFHTGDIGEVDADGFVKIVDRKRDIIVTSQGKNVAPQRVENLIKSKSPSIAHVVVVGDKRPYLTALIALERPNAEKLVQNRNADDPLSMPELAADQQVYEEVKRAIAEANASLASFEQIKRFHILDREFEIGRELTPTLKVKRKVCAEEFSREIGLLYSKSSG